MKNLETTRLAGTIPLVFVSTLLCFGQSSSAPASVISRFVGTWTANLAVNEAVNNAAPPPWIIRRSADGGLEAVDGTDAAPVITPFHLDGKPYEVNSGNNTAIEKQTGLNQFERQLFYGGQLVETSRLRISDDGKTLTGETERKRIDGTTNLITVIYTRTSVEGSGLAGVWAVQSRHAANPAQFTVSVAGANGLTLLRRNGLTYTTELDGKPVPVTGPRVVSGATVALRQIDDHTLAETSSLNGAVTGSTTWTLSPDGKVLTFTSTSVGPNASKTPAVSVYDKQ